MSPEIYLDDCAYDKELVAQLKKSGYKVVTPFDSHLVGQPDSLHFAYASQNDLILLTKNPHDFEVLHTLNPEHAGIIAVYQDNDPSKDMTASDIVEAIRNLIASKVPVKGQFHVLNAWRWPVERKE